MSPTPKLTLRSSIPGRERWEIEGLIGEHGIAEALHKALIKEPGITLVKANPVTGRVLICYKAGSNVRCRALLRTHLQEIIERGVVEPPKAGGNALARILRASPFSGRHMVASGLAIAVQIVAVSRRVTLISTINAALSSAGSPTTAMGAPLQAPDSQKAAESRKAPPSLGFMTGLLVFLVAVESVLEHFRSIAWAKLARETEERIRAPLLRHLEHQDVVFFEKQGSGRLMNLVIQDTATIGRFVETIGDNLVESVVSIVWAGGMLLWIAPSLFGLAMLPIPFVLIAAWALGPMVSKRMGIASASAATYNQHLGNSLAGIIDVKNFTAEDSEAARLVQQGRLVDETSVEATAASSIQYQTVQGIFGTGFSLAIGFAGSLVMTGQVLPDRTLHVLYWFPNLMSSLASLQGVTRQYHAAVRASENILTVMDQKPQIVSGPVRLPPKPERCEISFKSVGFGYEPDVKVLNDVSFTVGPGQMLAIVGPTGSGKSTLLRLLLRHYEVKEGGILFNQHDIRQLNLRDLRSAIGVVGQDVYLFQGTVRENVLYGRPDASEADLQRALRDSGTVRFLEDLPNGVESEVGERGQRLSGGQRQRIAIARALLKNAPILALDEATSQLDYETEGIVQRSIRTSATGRTLIVVAHRLSTVRRADEILVLESGQIVERGTHDELVSKRGLYASLWHLQHGSSDGPEASSDPSI